MSLSPRDAALGRVVLLRMVMAVFALLGALVALYLWLYHLGLSPLVCPIAGCEKVQKSEFSNLLGIPVAALGVAAFLALFTSSLAGVLRESLRLDRAVFIASSLGMLAYFWFTYLELAVIRAICFWWFISSLMMLGVWISSWLALRTLHRVASPIR